MSLLVFFWKLLPNPIVITDQIYTPQSDIVTYSNPDFGSSITIYLGQDLITYSNPSPNFRTTILTVIDSNISCLRYDDVALIQFIKSYFQENQFDYLNVIDGFPENEQLSIPSLAIEHNITYNRPFQITSKNRIYRSFNAYIYARTKGERDDISSALEAIENSIFETDDQRINTIILVEHISSDIKSSKLVSVKKNYWTIDFNGINTFAAISNSSDFNLTNFSVDIDLLVNQQTITGAKYIIDKYISSTRSGFRIFLDNNNRVWFSTGQGSFNASVFASLSSYIGSRAELSFKQIISGSSCTLQIYINNSLVSSSVFTISSSFVMGNKDIYIGARNNSLMDLHLLFSLYGLRISSNVNTIQFGRTGEYLKYDSSNDVVYLTLDEGTGLISRDKSLHSNNLQINNNFEWTNYLEDNIPGSNYFLSQYEIEIANEDIC